MVAQAGMHKNAQQQDAKVEVQADLEQLEKVLLWAARTVRANRLAIREQWPA